MTTPSPATSRAEFRARVLAQIANGATISDTATRHRLSTGTIHYWINNPRLAKPDGDRRYSLDWDALRAEVQRNPDAKLKDLAKQFRVSHNGIWQALKKMGIQLKRRNNTRRSARD